MKAIVLVLAIVATGAAPAVQAQTPPRRAAVAATRFSIDSKIVDLMREPKAKAVLTKHMPTLVTSPHLSQFEQMTIRELAANPHASLASAKIRALQADLVKLR